MNSRPSQTQPYFSPPEIRNTPSPIPHRLSLRRSHLCGAAVWLFALSPSLFAAPPPELTVLRQQYDKVVAERVTAPFDASFTELNTKYSAGLDRAIADAKAVGRLEDILAIEAEKKRLADKLPIPATDDDKEPESLKRFRGIYRQQLATIAAARDKAHADLLLPYTARLQALEATLVKNDRVDEAKEVLAYRQGLGQSGPLSPLSGAVPSAGTADAARGTARTTSSPASASKVKGDDRKAAEWVLSLGPKHKLMIDQRKPITSADQLPKGGFKVTVVQIDGRYLDGNPVTSETIQTLAGLSSLEELLISDVPELADKDFGFLATLPALKALILGRLGITDGVLPFVAELRELQELSFGELKNLSGSGLSALASLTRLEELKIGNGSLNDAGLAQLPKLSSLRTLNVQGNPGVTDASLPKLQSFNQLIRLFIPATGITPEGLKMFSMPNIAHGGCNSIASRAMSEIIPSAAKAFPKLSRYDVSYTVTTPEDFASLAHFPDLELIANWGDVSPEAWSGLAELRSLRSVESNGNRPIPDTAFEVMSAMRSLKVLKLGSYKPPAEVLASFKKKRPDVKVY